MFSFYTITFYSHAIYRPFFALSVIFSLTICFAPNIVAQRLTDTAGIAAGHLLTDKLEIGLAGGVALNSFTKEQPQTGSNVGYTAGISLQYKIWKNLSLRTELNMLQQGGRMIRFKDDTRYGLPESFDTKNVKNSSYDLNSLEIPLLINYTFPIQQVWLPALYAGGSYAYTYNATEHYQKTGDLLAGEDIISTVQGSQRVTSSFVRSRLNLVVGASVKLPVTEKIRLLLDFRYLNGVTAARSQYSYMEKAGFGTDVRSNTLVCKAGLVMAIH